MERAWGGDGGGEGDDDVCWGFGLGGWGEEEGRGEGGVEDAGELVVDEVAEVEGEGLGAAEEGEVGGGVFEVGPADAWGGGGLRGGGAPDFGVGEVLLGGGLDGEGGGGRGGGRYHDGEPVVLTPLGDGGEVEDDAVEGAGGWGVFGWGEVSVSLPFSGRRKGKGKYLPINGSS